MKNIIVLGGTGFVGRNICRIFDEENIKYAVVSRSKGTDISDTKKLKKILKREKPQFIVNCAANVGSLNYVTEQAANVILDNSKLIISMYEAVNEVCKNAIIINPIANCSYPDKNETFSEDSWWDGPLHPSVFSYGSSKKFLYSVGECFKMQYGIKSISLLVPNMYGPFDSTDPDKAHALNALVSKFVKAQKSGRKKIEIWGTGVAIREWLYARDFGKVVLQIINNPNMLGLAEPVNIAQNFGLSVKELVDIIQNQFGYKGKIIYDSSRPDGAPRKVMDDRKFLKVFPDFSFTPLAEGISETIGYYESVYPFK